MVTKIDIFTDLVRHNKCFMRVQSSATQISITEQQSSQRIQILNTQLINEISESQFIEKDLNDGDDEEHADADCVESYAMVIHRVRSSLWDGRRFEVFQFRDKSSAEFFGKDRQ